MMRKTIVLVLTTVLTLAAVMAASAQTNGWQRLAEKDVDFSLDHDRIDVDKDDAVREVRMSVQYSPVRFSRIVVTYKDGRKQEVPFAHLVEVNQFSPALTLSGDGGVIDSLDFWYSTEGMSGKKAKIAFYGRGMSREVRRDSVATAMGPMGHNTAGWQRLAEKDVNFSADHDRIDFDNDKAIREVRMSVQYSPVRFSRIVVTYKDGRKQDVPFAHLVEIDQFSPALTLSGDGGVIDELDFWYSTEGMSGKKAKVTLYGRGMTTMPGTAVPITSGNVMPVSMSTRKWKKIGKKDVNFTVDHDRIDADGKGDAREVRMEVRHSPVQFQRIVITYKNGTRQEVPFANLVQMDQLSPVVILEGNGSRMSAIDIWYSTEGMSGKKAKITFYGR